jgi:ATP-dependent exoDNAse (exonuclease V) alpha subunit
MIGALAAAYHQTGWHVIGAAPTARAARQLRDLAGIEAHTMHSLTAQLRRTGGLAPHAVLVLDEAGMAPTRRSADLLAHAEAAGAKVIAVGDPGQRGPVKAGGWLAVIHRQDDGPALRDVMRQHDPAEQDALEALHERDPDTYLAHKHDAITVHPTEIQALIQLTDGWQSAQQQHGRRRAVMITRDNLNRERLNRAARAKLRHDNLLSPDGMIVGGREYAPGDRVIARRNDRRIDLDNGSLSTVIAIDTTNGSIIVETDSGQPRALDRDYVARHLEHAYALGAQGATLAWAGVIGRPGDFTREWAYTALSRAQEQTTIHVISQRSERDQERDEYAPAEPDPEPERSRQMLHQAMKRTECEPLAADQIGPVGPDIHPPPTRRIPEPNGIDLLRRRHRQRGPSLRL